MARVRSCAVDAPTAAALAAAVRAGADPRDLVEQALARTAEVDGALGAFVLVDAEGARREAAARASEEPRGPLHGVPVGVKDLFDVAGQVTRAGSGVPAGPPAARDAAAVRALRAAGAVVLGRTRTHEFAWGITTQSEVQGGTRNPHDLGRVPGGSSGGSAAAVAAGLVPLALGTDTGASIRLPAAWCGLVGHKPSYGLVDLTGAVPLAASLDHGGALVRDARDARLALAVLGVELAPEAPTAGLRWARVDGLEDDLPDGEAVALPEGVAEVYRCVQAPEALAWHRATGRWPQHAAAYGRETRGHLERAERITEEQRAHGRAGREALRRWAAALFARVDLLLLPVATVPPPRVGDDAHLRAATIPWTALANLAGLPACSVPRGRDADGLPRSVQVVGPVGADARVLDAARDLAR